MIVSTPSEPRSTRFCTVAETAAMLRISPMTVYRLVGTEQLPGYRVGRAIRIPTAAVWAWVEGQRIRVGDLAYARAIDEDTISDQEDAPPPPELRLA